MEITCPNTKINYVAGTVYHHPTTKCKPILRIFERYSHRNQKKYFILGDMNLNTSNATLSFCCQKYLNMQNSNCLTNIINLPTRVTSTNATILHHIITNESKYQIYPMVIDYDITDHYPVLAIVHCDAGMQLRKEINFCT